MNIKMVATALVILALTMPSLTLAGHHYGGHGDMNMIWDMTTLDTDSNGVLKFDEFIAPNVEK